MGKAEDSKVKLNDRLSIRILVLSLTSEERISESTGRTLLAVWNTNRERCTVYRAVQVLQPTPYHRDGFIQGLQIESPLDPATLIAPLRWVLSRFQKGTVRLVAWRSRVKFAIPRSISNRHQEIQRASCQTWKSVRDICSLRSNIDP